MAEALAFMVGKQMMVKVLSLLAQELTLIWGFNDELKKLEESLEMVLSLICFASANNKTLIVPVQAWLNKLKALACDADAVLDEFIYETLRRKVEKRKRDKVKTLFSPSRNPLSFRLRMAHKIRNVKEKLVSIYEEGTSIGLVKLVELTDPASASTTGHREIRLTNSFIADDSGIIGRDDDILKIVNMLCEEEDDVVLPVLAIVGLGGQGKTTLAQLVLKHEKVKRHFNELIIWICVSDKFDIARLLNEMVQYFTGSNPQLSNVDGIIRSHLAEKLNQRRYLLVLDDVWNEDKDIWERFRNSLLATNAARGSKILVTTRSNHVASSMKASHIYPLKGLSLDESLKMFQQIAFREGGAVKTVNLEDIGREIVKRCAGLPMAVKVIGSLMYSKKSEKDWLSVQNRQLWNLEDDTNIVMQILELSYLELPLSVKHCFVVCSFYPKDRVIRKNDLVQIWMALGLLLPSLGSDLEMEDVGDKYFNMLLSHSFLQDANKDEYEVITTCKMHDLVHDLAQVTATKYYTTLPSQALLSTQLNSPAANLRVLVLENLGMKELPNSIETLIHLRYLDISKTNICALPNSICKLYNLQTLKVNMLLKVPKKFRNLLSLRHFFISDIDSSANCVLLGMERLMCLQTIPFFRVNQERGCHMKELGSLKSLRGDLIIYGLEQVENCEEARIAFLSEKLHIHALSLNWENRGENKEYNDENVLQGLEPHSNLEGLTIKNFAGRNFPQWMMMENQASAVLRNLVNIEVSNCNKCEKIPPLGQLPHLKFVKILKMSKVKVIGAEFYGKNTGGSASSSGATVAVTLFPALRELKLAYMPALEAWLGPVHQSVSMFVFPCLECLCIEGCTSLKILPSWFPSVKELKISGIDNSMVLKEMSNKVTSLISLDLKECAGYEFQAVLEGFSENNSSLRELRISCCDGFSCLPSNLVCLETLRLTCCYSLTDIPRLPSARKVLIEGCEKLVDLPSLTKVFPVIESMSFKLCKTMLAIPDIQSHISLRELVIDGLEQLRSVPELCKSLQILRIYNCPRLTSLPKELGTALNELEIRYCNALVSFPSFQHLRRLEILNNNAELDHLPWPSSSASTCCNLQSLMLRGGPKIKSLPEELQHLSALTHLGLRKFDGLESLPEWLGNLSSLQFLYIWSCGNLKYMPSLEAMRRLTKLTLLDILYCPILEERCTKGSRPEWYKISHISTITFD